MRCNVIWIKYIKIFTSKVLSLCLIYHCKNGQWGRGASEPTSSWSGHRQFVFFSVSKLCEKLKHAFFIYNLPPDLGCVRLTLFHLFQNRNKISKFSRDSQNSQTSS